MSRLEEAGLAPTFNDPEIDKHTLQETTSKTGEVLTNESGGESVPSSEVSSVPDVSETAESREIEEEPRLHGKSVVVTGTFEDYSREELEELVIRNGGQIRKSVSPFIAISLYQFSRPYDRKWCEGLSLTHLCFTIR